MSLLILLASPELLVLGIGVVMYVSSLFKRPEPVDWDALASWNE